VRKPLDFAFNVPNDYTPIALEFKQNCIMQVPRVVSADQAPPVSPFVEGSKVEPEASTPSDGAAGETFTRPSSNQGSSRDNTKRRGLSPVGRMLTGGVTDEADE